MTGWLTPFDGSGIEWHENLPNTYTYKESDFSKLVAAVHEYEAALREAQEREKEREAAFEEVERAATLAQTALREARAEVDGFDSMRVALEEAQVENVELEHELLEARERENRLCDSLARLIAAVDPYGLDNEFTPFAAHTEFAAAIFSAKELLAAVSPPADEARP